MSYSPKSKEHTYGLILQARAGDEAAKEQLITENTGLVKNLALKFANGGYELDDLLQVGFIGFLKAIDNFDTSFNVMFSTYAVPMILGEIKRFLRDDGRIKMGRQIKQDVKLISHFQEVYYNENGRYPKISDLAKLMDKNGEEIINILEAKDTLHNLESLDDPDRTEKDNLAFMQDNENSQVDMIHLKSVLGKLSERERQVIILRYFKDMTQQQIADRLAISQVQVSRIEKKVLTSLRREME